MSNMSYCRFQNTERDLDDCADALEAMLTEGGCALSPDELLAAKRLIAKCADILEMVAEATGRDLDEIVDDPTGLDLDQLNAGSGEPV